MIQISMQPLFHFLTHFLAIAPALVYAVILNVMFPRHFVSKTTRKTAPVAASTIRRNTLPTSHPNRRAF
jgi:hypothetical protein